MPSLLSVSRHAFQAIITSLHLKTVRLLDKMQELQPTCYKWLQRRLYPQWSHRMTQADAVLARPKQLHSPIPVKLLPSNPKSANELQDMTGSHNNSSGSDADPPRCDHAVVRLPTPQFPHQRQQNTNKIPGPCSTPDSRPIEQQ